jgi:hypothetical protein
MGTRYYGYSGCDLYLYLQPTQVPQSYPNPSRSLLVSRNIDKLEVKEMDGGDPPVNGNVRLTVRIIKHTLNEQCVHFYYEVVDPYKIELERMERTEKSIGLHFYLRVMSCMQVP